MAHPTEDGSTFRIHQGHPSPVARDQEMPEVYALLEPSKVKIPNRSIELANMGISKTFPSLAGKVIPFVDRRHIRVYTNSSFAQFSEGLEQETHSLRRALLLEGRQPINQTTSRAARYWATDRSVQGKPIYVPEGEIDLGSVEKKAQDAYNTMCIPAMLLHENYHRTSSLREIPTSSSDPLFSLAFAGERLSMERTQDPTEKERQKQAIDELAEYAATHDPVLRIGGTKVALLCRDGEGPRKIIAMSGQDLEEGIVYALTATTTPPIMEYAKRTCESELFNLFGGILNAIHASGNHFRSHNPQAELNEYFGQLGFTEMPEVIKAFADGTIPQLHVEKLGDEHPYFV